MKAVTTPIGSSSGEPIILASISDHIKNKDPKRIVSGISFLCTEPAIVLEIWGITRPTKPIIPLRDTIIPVNSVLVAIIIFFKSLMLTPKVIAASSPSKIASNVLWIIKAIIEETTKTKKLKVSHSI